MIYAPQEAEVRFVPLPAEHMRIAFASSAEGSVMITGHSGDSTMPPADRIVRTPGVCGGRPRVEGTRISVDVLAEAKASGVSDAQLLVDYPFLSAEDLAAAWIFVDNNPPQS